MKKQKEQPQAPPGKTTDEQSMPGTLKMGMDGNGKEKSDEMPESSMEQNASTAGQMNSGDEGMSNITVTEMGNLMHGNDDLEQVLVEMALPNTESASFALQKSSGLNLIGFEIDYNYDPVPLESPAESRLGLKGAEDKTVLVKGVIPKSKMAELEGQPNVIKVWKDTPIAPFDEMETAMMEEVEVDEPEIKIVKSAPAAPLGVCPIGTCDCTSGTPKGTIADVANYLGVNQIWASGFRGDGIVVGVVDGGITAAGRPINSADTSHPQWPNKLVPRVIGGWPVADWGTTGSPGSWRWHGNMCSTDVLGILTNVQKA